MQFEKIRTINKRKIIVGGLISLGVISALIYLPSRAKYRTTESINLANGTINYKVPDFKVVAMYQQNDVGTYDEITSMPSSDYIINAEKTYCTTDNVTQVKGKIKTENGEIILQSLTKGEKCYLYFDKVKITNSTELIANSKINTYSPDFSQVAITDEGIYQIPDGMYSGTSYYYRGAVENNYVKFANFCWRIIRINGDGSIRLIYDGESCHANGTSTEESIVVASQAYNSNYDRSEYVGYTYEEGLQRPSDNATATASNLKTQTDSWYKTNISDKGYDGKVADGKFCNDRNVQSGLTWASQPSFQFHYSGNDRIGVNGPSNVIPTLTCPSGDVYTPKAGAITMDEIIFAGGKWATVNAQYYLYNGQYYWTMTPFWWFYYSPSERIVSIFSVSNAGLIWFSDVNVTALGMRPVINLKADTVFSSGDGTLNNPYIVA